MTAGKAQSGGKVESGVGDIVQCHTPSIPIVPSIDDIAKTCISPLWLITGRNNCDKLVGLCLGRG